ncbi:Eukaryotic translation initiation factor 3 subunit H [Zancudomyces culisetae]|uniref:Eukaryotic translation initiation factor 3 subunit H n=1 Tax=Zancudomyces culisetae TaxID=1213189 RepID=A0A1R1PU25_ZANCU|nr:Eukaryotic translation initiation factor 3 subunit H [Zancudomyces culisetae]|eukprot:OMH84470.1 Eukaryotic translation initiation factor 3 subunit H [Zancudomyces culisetae]
MAEKVQKSMAKFLAREAEEEIDLTLPKHLEWIEESEGAGKRTVVIEPMVAFKIIKHAREQYPNTVNGQVVGLEVRGGTLEVTNCFPVPAQFRNETEETNYQLEMMNYLQEVNMESNLIGWYFSTKNGRFMQRSYLDMQVAYQESSTNKAIVLVHDVARTKNGAFSLRAFQLTDKFLELIKQKKQKKQDQQPSDDAGFSIEDEDINTEDILKSKLSFNNIYEEIPVSIKNLSLMKVLMYEMEKQQCENAKPTNWMEPGAEGAKDNKNVRTAIEEGGFGSKFDTLALKPINSLQEQLGMMTECIDQYIQDANSWMYWKRGTAKEMSKRQAYIARKRQERNAVRVASGQEPLPVPSINSPLDLSTLEEDEKKEVEKMFKLQKEPGRLNSVLNMAQLHIMTKQTTQITGPSIARLYAVKSFDTSE